MIQFTRCTHSLAWIERLSSEQKVASSNLAGCAFEIVIVSESHKCYDKFVKVCKKCLLCKPLDAFCFKNKAKGLKQAQCKICTRLAIREHYAKNKGYYLNKAKKRNKTIRDEVRSYILEYLTNHPCVDCGEKDIVVLTFDHIGFKIANIADMSHWRFSLDKVKKEITKCVVRCANCHLRRTAKQFKWGKLTYISTK